MDGSGLLGKVEGCLETMSTHFFNRHMHIMLPLHLWLIILGF